MLKVITLIYMFHWTSTVKIFKHLTYTAPSQYSSLLNFWICCGKFLNHKVAIVKYGRVKEEYCYNKKCFLRPLEF